jgi:hypothetical protein
MTFPGLPDPAFVTRVNEIYERLTQKDIEPIDPTSPIADQYAASLAETHRLIEDVLPAIEEDSDLTWSGWVDQAPPRTVAYLKAAIDAEDILYCNHVHAPQPLFAFLTPRMVVCRACMRYVPRTPPDPSDDSCDYCRRTGVKQFTPHLTVVGSITVSGEACDDCTEALRIA